MQLKGWGFNSLLKETTRSKRRACYMRKICFIFASCPSILTLCPALTKRWLHHLRRAHDSEEWFRPFRFTISTTTSSRRFSYDSDVWFRLLGTTFFASTRSPTKIILSPSSMHGNHILPFNTVLNQNNLKPEFYASLGDKQGTCGESDGVQLGSLYIAQRVRSQAWLIFRLSRFKFLSTYLCDILIHGHSG